MYCLGIISARESDGAVELRLAWYWKPVGSEQCSSQTLGGFIASCLRAMESFREPVDGCSEV